MKNNSTWNQWIAPIVVLVAICLVITFALAETNSFTAPVIAANEKATADQARTELLSDGDAFTQYDGELIPATSDGKCHVEEVYTADNGAGVVITVVTKSFGGDLTEMIGIDKDGAITGVKVTKHADTAGLGTKAHDPAHVVNYVGVKELNSTKAKEETATIGEQNDGAWYITGATISSNAVHYGVHEALAQFEAMGGEQ
ncbi:MAG: FMN-binding protein [Clostridia bacterium]|nr:FMN-binding protein [Clostridia bacterium]